MQCVTANRVRCCFGGWVKTNHHRGVRHSLATVMHLPIHNHRSPAVSSLVLSTPVPSKQKNEMAPVVYTMCSYATIPLEPSHTSDENVTPNGLGCACQVQANQKERGLKEACEEKVPKMNPWRDGFVSFVRRTDELSSEAPNFPNRFLTAFGTYGDVRSFARPIAPKHTFPAMNTTFVNWYVAKPISFFGLDQFGGLTLKLQKGQNAPR